MNWINQPFNMNRVNNPSHLDFTWGDPRHVQPGIPYFEYNRFLPDLLPVDATFNPHSRQLSITVANNGNIAADTTLTKVFIPKCGWQPLIPTPTIKPGHSAKILSPKIPLRVCGNRPGYNEYNIWITVDADNRIRESNETNNTLFKQIRPMLID